MTKSELKQLIKEVIREMSVNENYEDSIKDTKDRMAYLALRKQEKDYISKSKQSSSPIKKQHYMDMSKQVLDKALDILKKHKVVDEMYSDTSYKTQKGYDAAKKKIQALKDELNRIQDLKNKSDYNDTNDPQARNYHDRRLKEIPKLISAIRQKILGLKEEANTKELQKLGFTPTKSDVNEVKGYVLGPMDQASSWIAWNKKPKNKNGKQMYVVSAAEFQKQFPNIQMKQLPTNPSKYSDYYIVDNEGDLIAYSQANVGSGLD
jgi:hypothetical protein